MASKKTLKKFFAILTALFMLVSVFSSCKENKKEDDTQTTTNPTIQSAADGESELVQEDNRTYKPYEEVRVSPNLPNYNWNGYTFKVLTQRSESAGSIDGVNIPSDNQWVPRDIAAEEETGETINDAVYRRNATLQSKYNFKMEQLFTDNIYVTLRKAVASGDKYFDVTSISASGGAVLAQEGIFVDLNYVHYLDFDQPWWDKGAISGLSIDQKIFLATGDFGLVNKDATSAILFNKQLLADLDLESPYEFVRNGQWTIEKLYEMAKGAALDLNGDGKMEWENDRFGFIPPPISVAMMHSCGERYSVKDENDMPVLTLGGERMYLVWDAIQNLSRADFSGNEDVEWVGAAGLRSGERMFLENRGLFLESYINAVEKLRGMETDFGILPMPKFNEYQKEWGHTAESSYAQLLAVPTFHDEASLDRIGFTLEAISAESRYTIIPAYYDIQLKGKFARDEESIEMLDIIFSSMVWDTALFYGWLDGHMGMNVSSIERRLGVIETNMQKTIDKLAKVY